MSESDLLTIGAFARSCGLSASALRFYADAGVLVPAVVDETTGYRYYAPGQAATARLIRYLRAVEMPLPAVAAVLAEPDPACALGLVDTHLADLDRHLDAVRSAATAARAAVRALWARRACDDPSAADPATPPPDRASTTGPGATGAGGVARSSFTAPRIDAVGAASRTESPGDRHDPDFPAPPSQGRTADIVWMRGPHLAAAIDQIATATVADTNLPVLNSIHLESTATDLILTATDRYLLATRTLRPAHPSTTAWTATVDADDLRATSSWLRRAHTVALRPTPTHLECVAVDSVPTVRVPATGPSARRCRRSPEPFPDYRAMLAALPAVTTRVVVPRTVLLDLLERSSASMITLLIESTGAVRATFGSETWQLPATATGPGLTVHFAVTTLYPAVACSFGPDLLIDLSAPDQPALLRAADDGTLLTLVMPRRDDTTEPA
ncbi:MerR family transcriptional regulator [Nocardia neocaledoniensis]|uniref:MerR family transcriptional regulator n=1 Tax=Nocardia neocaledoniensis TaxID=236511 RepID=UPI00245680DA|nr:MerR family transcriptional regulator [Nocardia neocaledoniensis]